MPRPTTITDEDIKRYSKILDEDDTTPLPFRQIDHLREICYAGLWLVEQLEALNCDETLLIQIQFTHGYNSLGVDTWDEATKLLDAYKNGTIEIDVEPDPSSLN